MNIFSRFIDIINANMNAMLDKAEDPEKMLRMMIQEMEDTLIELKSSCASSMAEGAKLEKAVKEAEEASQRWEKRAMLAISKGKEDLAREALAEKLQMKKEAEQSAKLLEENRATVAESRKDIASLEEKLSESKARFRIIKEKQERARNEKKARESIRKDTEARFEEMEKRINRMNAENDLNRGFEEMEKSDEIERELAELKKKAGI
ncbi:MAG: PspA/IM30 family protein [Spirochaetes bacterium]|uniref:PspA/IM30 family protein n=1 Tax=Candidatus Ornithospirochaeta stercoripullorum TaxID=2840899 RepID=A0A9D9DXF2_9SPIO|nr:PspA/IM30 family protein [Candidatus Ornithospirochaeta stercoripullorum]